MAYVGTASWQQSDRYTLASIIAGEAGNEGEAGMRAVASVIQNRARANFSNYGTSLVSQATARMQFQGQAMPTAGSYKIADELLAGGLKSNVGGALYYANPSASTARWATRLNSSNAYKLGNHYFTDNTKGTPFTGPAGDKLGASSGVSAENANNPWNPNDVGTPAVGAVKISGDLVEATDTQTIQQAQSASQQADAIIAAAAQQASTDATVQKATLDTQQGWLSWISASLGDWFQRGFIVALGLVFVAGAIALIVWKGKDALPSMKEAAVAAAV